MNLWFTADTHFNHRKMLEFRPWSTTQEMDEALIDNWNSCVQRGDIIYHLGDFCLAARPSLYMPRLHGQIQVIKGNHDERNYWNEIRELAVWTGEAKYIKYKDKKFYLSHYAHRVWRCSHRGSFHVYGHSHGNLPGGWGRSMDVGVDAVGYKPIHIDEVIALLETKDPVDHHPETDNEAV